MLQRSRSFSCPVAVAFAVSLTTLTVPWSASKNDKYGKSRQEQGKLFFGVEFDLGLLSASVW